MKKTSAFILLFAAASLTATAQRPARRTVMPEWEPNPKVHPVPPEYGKEAAIILLHDVKMDYRYEGKATNVYYTLHRLVKVMDEKGIEWFNKIEIPVSRNTRVPLIKARTILPNGKVHDIEKEMIKVTRNEYGQNMIVIAMEGVEKNAEIELLVNEIKPLQLFGSETFQYSVPVLKARMELSYPKELVFEQKGFNGFPTATDTLLYNRRHIIAEKNNIPALKREKHSFYDLYRMRAEYRIASVKNDYENDNGRLYSWDDLARRLHEEHYKITDKEKKSVNQYLSDLGVSSVGNELEKIRKIENGIKGGIVKYSYIDDDNEDNLDSIISKKAATETGMIKLFAACFTQAAIPNQLGVTTDRHEHTLNTRFENWGTLENYVFYFPGVNKYLSPTATYYRCPMVPDDILTNKCVLCTMPNDGSKTNGTLYEIRTIAPLSAADCNEKMDATVSFTKAMEPEVTVGYWFTGYKALDLRKEMLTASKDKMKELVKSTVAFADRKDQIISYTTANQDFEYAYANKPLEIKANVSAPQLMEQAGSKYLLKLGEIIGDQEQMYDEGERKMPVDLDYPHSLTRTITVNIPVGYKVLNPEATKLNADYLNKDMKPVIGFSSDYKIQTDKKNGDKLVVTVKEFYSQTHFPLAEYERYRKVVNTASDFSKVTLLLGKKG